jgi:hypothetical protein
VRAGRLQRGTWEGRYVYFAAAVADEQRARRRASRSASAPELSLTERLAAESSEGCGDVVAQQTGRKRVTSEHQVNR